MLRRTTEGRMNARREAEADIRQALYVAPNGRGFDLVQDVETGQEYTVRDLSGGTVAPGSRVPIGGYSGSAEEFRFGATRGGGSKFGTPPRGSRPYGTTPPVVTANQYAFWKDGDDFHAWLYNEGDFLAARAVYSGGNFSYGSGGGGANFPTIIYTDSSELVGDGSLIGFSNSPVAPAVWDVASNTIKTYAVPAGWTAGAAQYLNGFLWWLESTDTTAHATTVYQIRLRKGTTDLATVTTVSTWSSPAVVLPATFLMELAYGSQTDQPVVTYPRPMALATTTAYCLASWKYDNVGGGTNFNRYLGFPLDGGTIVERVMGNNKDLENLLVEELGGKGASGNGRPRPGGGSLIPFYYDFNSGFRIYGPLSLQPDDVDEGATEFWPDAFGAPLLQTGSLSPGGGLFQMSFGPGVYYRDSAATAPDGPTPAVSFTVNDHPDFPGSGSGAFLYYFGEDS